MRLENLQVSHSLTEIWTMHLVNTSKVFGSQINNKQILGPIVWPEDIHVNPGGYVPNLLSSHIASSVVYTTF
jgi:hypothetical protein